MSDTPPVWPDDLYAALKRAGVTQVGYVPDAGHARLIERCRADDGMRAVPLTTEEEGVALAAGAWLGGARAVLLMQSSGVGNCINALSLIKNCQIPFLTFVTMRGDFGEANNWQMAMGQATPTVLEAMGMVCLRVEKAEDIEETVSAALRMSFSASQSIAVLLSQRLIGAKIFK